ncbi:TRADD-N-associated membrane domain-containing protein [Flavobacterium sp. F52]|uniref:TRADD-N-associated membrane domain-containing protein n=1 Tax=Flavobacterium sp. F52 TaxID=1202532 RepID=UPI000272EF5B|nr:hypothetical protein [Flavobacterium sp. F52]EJG01417.1 hypothetical protein FF52_10173 [Flavobacterium sp. F52]
MTTNIESFSEYFRLLLPIILAFASVSFLSNFLLKTKFERIKNENDMTQETESNYYTTPDIGLSTNERQFELLKRYHSQGLFQSRISFWFSLIFATLGFAIIAFAILSTDNSKTFWSQSNSIISLISGTIIDSVSALFFVQSNKSRELMANFFDKLRTDRKIEESLKLCDEIPDEYLRSKLKLILSLHFAEITPSDAIISMVFKELQERKDGEFV